MWLKPFDQTSFRGHSITTWTRWGGGGLKISVFVHTLGVKTVHAERGERGQKWQNSVHVVVECPLSSKFHLISDVSSQTAATKKYCENNQIFPSCRSLSESRLNQKSISKWNVNLFLIFGKLQVYNKSWLQIALFWYMTSFFKYVCNVSFSLDII